jgi:hypothetical protein
VCLVNKQVLRKVGDEFVLWNGGKKCVAVHIVSVALCSETQERHGHLFFVFHRRSPSLFSFCFFKKTRF